MVQISSRSFTIMKILSFDQSTRLTAYAVFVNGDLVKHDLIKIKTKDADKRFIEMCRSVFDIITQEKPDVVVCEDVSLQTNAAVLTSLARLLGAIVGWCIFDGVDYYTYYASQWRRIIGFTGQKKCDSDEDSVKKKCDRTYYKEKAIAYIKDKFDIDEGDDVAESICIGLAYMKDKGIKDNV